MTTSRPKPRVSPLYYIVEHDWDGYSQRFSKIGGWRDVLKWARDGSIKDGEQVYAVHMCRQPPTRTTTPKGGGRKAK